MRVPEQLMRAMAAEAEAARNARAKVITFIITFFIVNINMMIISTKLMIKVMVYMQVIAAEGEHKASRSLRLAAEVIADSPAALQVGMQGW